MNRFFLVPLGVFLVLAGFLGLGLLRDPHELPSPLIGKPAPAFSLPTLGAPGKGDGPAFGPHELRGRVWVLNVWASWCATCREEHPVLLELAQRGIVPLVGLDYKDQPNEAHGRLTRFGNPYTLLALDADGRVGIDYGVYGVPETYVIDKAGVIRFKHIGALTPEVLNTKLLPLIQELQR
ncbi:DsbE family thiol:disulfide interchange protein [Pelomonas cellulosilytica]|uniref:DsbE family thiol:disulfide interchange protein n=1 Tax=Pelomonas cellulosilytica TaxID=2906762 RepID=A0ABS8XNN3_9BURK|nr:DsbE family thiol:disulfide interchange protein [Pelomonas sp. P8]MCE4552910.1 DsbE family thiol:disulfide interchange protein [Pelomonas sp. P8]